VCSSVGRITSSGSSPSESDSRGGGEQERARRGGGVMSRSISISSKGAIGSGVAFRGERCMVGGGVV
jgi:hypothetical protein